MAEDIKEDAREYELSYLISDPNEAEGVFGVLAECGAEVTAKGQPMSVRLAYPIKKQLSAWFGFVYFRALPESAEKISEMLKVKPLLRFLVIVSPAKAASREARKPRPAEPKPEANEPAALTNEALEQKLEEILK